MPAARQGILTVLIHPSQGGIVQAMRTALIAAISSYLSSLRGAKRRSNPFLLIEQCIASLRSQ
jgi:hypothetical protein